MLLDRNIYSYASPSEERRKDRIIRKYSVDVGGKTVGEIKCVIFKSSDKAEIDVLIDDQILLQWKCENLVNDAVQYSCLVCTNGDEFDDFFLHIDKSKAGTVCDIQKSDRFSQVTKVSKLASVSSFRLVDHEVELPFAVSGDYSLLRMMECVFSILTIGLYRPGNDDFMTGVCSDDLTAEEVRNLIIINSTMRMVFTAHDFSRGS